MVASLPVVITLRFPLAGDAGDRVLVQQSAGVGEGAQTGYRVSGCETPRRSRVDCTAALSGGRSGHGECSARDHDRLLAAVVDHLDDVLTVLVDRCICIGLGGGG